MTRADLSFICTPFYSIAWALRLDIATPDLPPHIEGYLAYVLTGIIAGLTPIVGTVIARGIQGALGVSLTVTPTPTKAEESNVQ